MSEWTVVMVVRATVIDIRQETEIDIVSKKQMRKSSVQLNLP